MKPQLEISRFPAPSRLRVTGWRPPVTQSHRQRNPMAPGVSGSREDTDLIRGFLDPWVPTAKPAHGWDPMDAMRERYSVRPPLSANSFTHKSVLFLLVETCLRIKWDEYFGCFGLKIILDFYSNNLCFNIKTFPTYLCIKSIRDKIGAPCWPWGLGPPTCAPTFVKAQTIHRVEQVRLILQ